MGIAEAVVVVLAALLISHGAHTDVESEKKTAIDTNTQVALCDKETVMARLVERDLTVPYREQTYRVGTALCTPRNNAERDAGSPLALTTAGTRQEPDSVIRYSVRYVERILAVPNSARDVMTSVAY